MFTRLVDLPVVADEDRAVVGNPDIAKREHCFDDFVGRADDRDPAGGFRTLVTQHRLIRRHLLVQSKRLGHTPTRSFRVVCHNRWDERHHARRLPACGGRCITHAWHDMRPQGPRTSHPGHRSVRDAAGEAEHSRAERSEKHWKLRCRTEAREERMDSVVRAIEVHSPRAQERHDYREVLLEHVNGPLERQTPHVAHHPVVIQTEPKSEAAARKKIHRCRLLCEMDREGRPDVRGRGSEFDARHFTRKHAEQYEGIPVELLADPVASEAISLGVTSVLDERSHVEGALLRYRVRLLTHQAYPHPGMVTY